MLGWLGPYRVFPCQTLTRFVETPWKKSCSPNVQHQLNKKNQPSTRTPTYIYTHTLIRTLEGTNQTLFNIFHIFTPPDRENQPSSSSSFCLWIFNGGINEKIVCSVGHVLCTLVHVGSASWRNQATWRNGGGKKKLVSIWVTAKGTSDSIRTFMQDHRPKREQAAMLTEDEFWHPPGSPDRWQTWGEGADIFVPSSTLIWCAGAFHW